MASKSKKIQKVIDGIRAWNLSSSTSSQRSEIEETLKSDHLKFGKIVQYGFPFEPSCIAYEPVQKLLIIGTKSGSGRILGRPGVDHQFKQPSGCGIIQIIFLINQGSFLTLCNDETVHLWNYQSKPVELVQSLQFKRENLTCAFLSPGASWLYVGTVKGNVFFVNIKKFFISGYIINWNKAIDLSQSTHPGSVVQLGESPADPHRLLIGFSTGFLAIWNLKEKAAKFRFKFSEALCGFSWFPDGKNFITCHYGGYLVTWNSRQSNTPLSVIRPHNRDSQVDSKVIFEPIRKVVLLNTKSEETIIVFSGGTIKSVTSSTSSSNPNLSDSTNTATNNTSSTSACALPSVTVMKNKRLTILQMDYPIIDFVELCEMCYSNTIPTDPFGIAILLENDLMVIDLLSPNYPSFENPYPVDIHVSPVTSLRYVSDCPGDFVANLYIAKPRQNTTKKTTSTAASNPNNSTNNSTSNNSSATTSNTNTATSNTAPTSSAASSSSHEWPINGGQWGSLLNSNSELIITGHEDGSLRFWDATGTNLTSLYKFRLTTFLERGCSAAISSSSNTNTVVQQSPTSPEPAPLDECGCPRTIFEPSTSANISTNHDDQSSLKPPHYPYYPDEVAKQLAIEKIQLCSDTKKLMVAGKHFVTMLSFTKREVICDVPVLDISIQYDVQEDAEVITTDDFMQINKQSTLTPKSSVFGYDEKDLRVFVGVKSGLIKWAPGYQPDVICRLGSTDSTIPSQISCIGFHSHYGLMAFGNEQGFAIVDFVQKVCLMSSGTPDLYGSNDPYNRISWSPGNRKDETPGNASSGIGSGNTAVGSGGKSSCSDAQYVGSNGTGGSTSGGSIDQCFEPMGSTSGSGQKTTTPTSNITSNRASGSHLYKQQELKRNKSQGFNNKIWGKLMKALWIVDNYEAGHFSRSTSSSTSSLDNISCEKITSVSFADTYSRKSDSCPKPCLWLGTSLGSVIPININLPDLRTTQPVIVSPSGNIYRLKGGISCIGFLDSSGELISSFTYTPDVSNSSNTAASNSIGSVSTPNMSKRLASQMTIGGGPTGSGGPSGSSSNYISKQQSTVSNSSSSHGITNNMTSSGIQSQQSCTDIVDWASNSANSGSDSQFLVLCSEKSAEVVALPSQSPISRIKITETSVVIQSTIINIKSGPPCLVAQLANGHLMAFSLPSLRLLMDIGEYCKFEEALAVSIANFGMIISLISVSELEKMTISAEFSNNIKNTQGDLYIQKELPTPPKKSFFETLFTNTVEIDRDELFGEAGAGKGSIATATVTTKMMDKAHMGSANAQSEIAKARMAALERGEKLSETELKTQEMMEHAKVFSKNASALAAKYEKKDKRWGLPF